jgi:hypothetical protein
MNLPHGFGWWFFVNIGQEYSPYKTRICIGDAARSSYLILTGLMILSVVPVIMGSKLQPAAVSCL